MSFIVTSRTRHRQPQGVAPLNRAFSAGLDGLWLPSAGATDIAKGRALTPLSTGAPALIGGKDGRAWSNSGLALGSAASPGYDTNVPPPTTAFTFLLVFRSYDAVSSAGFGSPLLSTWVGFQYHHVSSTYQSCVILNNGGWVTAAFTPPAVGDMCVWIGTYDGSTLSAYTNGVLTGSASASGTITGGGGNVRLLSRDGEYNWNGAVYLGAYWPSAIPVWARRALGKEPWQLIAPQRAPVFYSISGSPSAIIASYRMRRPGLSRVWR